MSWFGFGKKEEKPKVKTEAEKKRELEIKKEQEAFQNAKAMEKLTGQMSKLEAKIVKGEDEVRQLDTQIRQLVATKNPSNMNKAKQLITRKKQKENNLKTMNNQNNFLQKQHMQLEQAGDDKDMADALGDANKVIAGQLENQEKYREALEEARELQQETDMNREMINDMMEDANEMEDVDDELAQYLEDDAMKEYDTGFDDANANMQPVQQQQVKPQVQQNKPDALFNDIMNL